MAGGLYWKAAEYQGFLPALSLDGSPPEVAARSFAGGPCREELINGNWLMPFDFQGTRPMGGGFRADSDEMQVFMPGALKCLV